MLKVAVGVARVWAGVHYPGDIAAGAVIGLPAVGAVVAYRWMPVSGLSGGSR